jgi:hypothetical protein
MAGCGVSEKRKEMIPPVNLFQRMPQKTPKKNPNVRPVGPLEESIRATPAGEPVSEPMPEVAALDRPKRRGRPPKGDKAMTAAERKATQRAKEKMDKQVQEIQEEHHDNAGRLHGERSGEKDRKYGQSEIETIINQRTINENNNHGRRVNKNSNEAALDDDAGSDGKSTFDRRRASPREQRYFEKIGEAIRIVAEACIKDGWCRLCGKSVPDAEGHIYKAYKNEEKTWEDYDSLPEDVDQGIRDALLEVAKNGRHYEAVRRTRKRIT